MDEEVRGHQLNPALPVLQQRDRVGNLLLRHGQHHSNRLVVCWLFTVRGDLRSILRDRLRTALASPRCRSDRSSRHAHPRQLSGGVLMPMTPITPGYPAEKKFGWCRTRATGAEMSSKIMGEAPESEGRA